MTVVCMNKTTLNVTQYNKVTNIAYNATTKVYTITHQGGTATASANDWVLSVLFA